MKEWIDLSGSYSDCSVSISYGVKSNASFFLQFSYTLMLKQIKSYCFFITAASVQWHGRWDVIGLGGMRSDSMGLGGIDLYIE